MKYEFVQMTARKDTGDFACCSNLSLMDSEGLSPAQALAKLERMAERYGWSGYSIEWIREEMPAEEVEPWGLAELFNRDEA